MEKRKLLHGLLHGDSRLPRWAMRTTWIASLAFAAIIAAGVVQAGVPARIGVRGTVPNPGTQQQELGNITLPAPYNTFEFVVTCAGCHGGAIDQTAGHFSNWAGTSMASSARDPFFRANQIGVNNAVRAALINAGVPEAEANGAGNMCMRCHSPNGWYSGRFDPTLNGDPEGKTMMHSIVLSTDDEGILCEACHRTIGNVTMKRGDLDQNDPVWNMLAGIADWPHGGLPFVDQAGDPTIASGNPYGDTSLQINDGMTYIGKYSGTSDVFSSDIPTTGSYTGQTYGIYPNPWSGPRNPVPAGEPQFNAAGEEIAYTPDGGTLLHFEVPIGPPVNPQTGAVDYLAQAISLEHPTVGDRPAMGNVPTENKFLRSSEFCGTCHDLTVPVLNHGMPEQRTYTEWKFSEFGDGDGTADRRCQDCHMPTQKHEFSDAASPSVNADPILSGWFPYAKDRSPQGGTAFHKFAGANRDLGGAMQALYPEPDLEVLGAPTGNDPRIFPGMLSTRDPMYDRAERNSEIMLQNGVDLQILSGPTYNAQSGRWSVQLKVENKSGHRIPSGYPDGRRFWIELQVKNNIGATVYESGHYDAAEAKLQNSSSDATFARALEPNIDSSSNAVMVYERVTGTCAGGACTPSSSLLNNVILFDNRILAKGFDYEALRQAGVKFWNYDPATKVPYEDLDRYPAGQNWDVVTYTFDAPSNAQLTVRAELYWQTHSRAFVEHLRTQDTSTVRPEGPPNILDPNYPLNPNYLSEQIDLAGVEAQMKLDGWVPEGGWKPSGATLNDNWGGIAYAAWYATGKGTPFLVTVKDTGVTTPPAPANVHVYPEYDQNGHPINGVINPDTGTLEPYTQLITWDPVAGADGYRVWIRYGTSDTTADWDRLAIVQGSTALTHTALSVNKTYAYKVEAFNGAGYGPDSAMVEGTTPWDLPLAPDNLQFIGSTTNRVTMNWYDPNDNEDGHLIYRQNVPPVGNFVEIADMASAVLFGGVQFVDGDLTQPDVTWAPGYTEPAPGTCYNYVVVAYNASGDSGWNANGPIQMCTQGPPSKPDNLVATSISAGRIDLTWAVPNGIVAGYYLERATDAGFTNVVTATLASEAVSYSDTSVQPETQYWYRLRAFNAAGSGPVSEPANATTPPAPPLPPSNLLAAASAPGPVAPTVTLTWTDNATNETGFVVQRAPDVSGVPGTFANVVTINQPKAGSGSQVVRVDNTVQPKSTYWYRVYAFNAAGASAYSNEVSVVTPGEPPQTPSNLRMLSVTSSSITLGWNDNSANEQGFTLQRSMNGTSGWTDIAATLAANTITYRNTGLTSRTNYYYRIRAYNADGASAWSNSPAIRTR